MSALFESIADLKKVVKINASMPFESIEPFINDAADIYLVPHISSEVLEAAAAADANSHLKGLVRRALGPLSLALATDELGIMYGDSGITVQNEQGKRSPANDSKIQAAKENLMLRGKQALDRLIGWLYDHKDTYPSFNDMGSETARGFIRNALEYQGDGGVYIDNSHVSFRQLLPYILQLQESDIRPLLTDDVYVKLLANSDLNTKQSVLRRTIVMYLANRSAGLCTSQNSRRQRQGSRVVPEFQPLIRPLYSDQDDSLNWYMRQADFYMGQIKGLIESEAEELGLPQRPDGLMHYNEKDRKFVTSIL